MVDMASKMDDQIDGAISENERLCIENDRLKELLSWSYSKLHSRNFSDMNDCLKLDEIKLFLEHGI